MAAPRTDLSRRARWPGAWRGGWWRWAVRVRSPHHNARPANLPVDLVVLHSISLPAGQFGGPWITDLFLGRLDTRAHESFTALAGLRVSAHFLIRRSGAVLQFVDTRRRAWHAGLSCWQGRKNCNDFSIGIELEGLEGDGFEPAQYGALARLLRSLARQFPIQAVVGHEHVAPGRKGDPGPGFDWARLRRLLRMRRPWLHGQSPEPAHAVGRTRGRTGDIGRSTVRHTTASGL